MSHSRRRHVLRGSGYNSLSRCRPAGCRPLFDQPLVERRRQLCQLVLDRPQVVFSEGTFGPGGVLFEEICRQGLEGLVAKRLASRYRPGKRTTAWLKIKPRLR